MIVNTKLHIPRVLDSLVARLRLMDKLSEGMEAKLTVISAQAGYGKTTMLSQWAKQCGSLVAWVSLDKQDNDWIEFWSYLLAAIRERIPGFGVQIEPYLEKGPSATSLSSEPAIKALLNELSQLNGELAIILDDYHFINIPVINNSVSYLLEHLPPHIHMFIASRNELSIPTARLLAKGELLQINMQDLRFKLDEGLVFFEDKTGLSLTKDQAKELLYQTEGWISGLQLAVISLKRSSNMAESIKQFSGRQHNIADYLLEEVFHNLAEPLRDFLLETSILTRMNSSLCEAITGQANCQEHLAKLEQLNLFIIPLDDERNWYRYHHLLSDFLQHLLLNGNPDKWALAHTNAARWLERQGFVEEAAEHYLEGREYEDVVRLIENNLKALMQKKFLALSRWVLQLPESYISKRPMVEMVYLLLLLGTGQWEAAHIKIEQARIGYEALESKMDEADKNKTMGNIYFLSGISYYLQKNLEKISEYFELADQYLPEGSLFQLVGNNNNHGPEEFDDHLIFINDYHGAAAFLLKWINSWGHKKAHPFVGPLYASYSKLLYEWNRLEEAKYWISQMLKLNDMPTIARILLQIYVSASQIEQALENPVRANELLEQLKLQIDSPDYELYIRKIEAEQASLSVRQGSIQYGMEWLERCGMTYTDEVNLNDITLHLALARVLAACGHAEQALFLAERLYQLLYKNDRLRDQIKVLILQSMILYRIGQTEEAQSKLETALYLAEPEGFIRSFIDEGPLMAELLSACKLQRNRRSSGAPPISYAYIEILLQAMNVMPEPMNVSRIKAHCFSRFRLLGGNGELAEIKWRTSKAGELMAYLVHQRGVAVDRHLILDSLWGNYDVGKAAAQLNLTVHYIRNSLRNAGIEGLLHHASGLYKIDMERIDCDAYEFDKRATKVDGVSADNIDECEQIAALYKGGYMESNDYSWTEQVRGNLEHEYIVLLMQMQDYYVNERKFRQAVKILRKAITCTPWAEDIHARLIEVYLLANDPIAAMKQFDTLRRMLKTEYSSEPKESVKRLLGLN